MIRDRLCGEFGRTPDNGCAVDRRTESTHNPNAMTHLDAVAVATLAHIYPVATDENGDDGSGRSPSCSRFHVTLLRLLGVGTTTS